MRNPSRAITRSAAALAVALLLLLWLARRAPSPVSGRNPAELSPAPIEPVVTPSSLSPSPAPAPPAGAAPVPASGDRVKLVRHCLNLAETDPLAAMELAIAQKLTADDPGLLNALILRWAERDFSGALEWTRTQPLDAGRDDILAHLAYLRSISAPAAAAEIAATEIAGPRARAEAILSVVHQWAQRAPEEALAWSERLADADLRRRALDEIAAVQAHRLAAPANTDMRLNQFGR